MSCKKQSKGYTANTKSAWLTLHAPGHLLLQLSVLMQLQQLVHLQELRLLLLFQELHQ